MAKGKSITVPFVVEKETPGTFRFAEVGEDKSKHKIGTLYIKKNTVSELGDPKGIRVTIEAV